MVIFVRKWNFFLVLLAFVLLMGGIGFACRQDVSRAVTGVPGQDKKIVIDAGHGSPDGGAVGNSGIPEKDLNLSIAKLVQMYFEQSGIEVVMTRTDDAGLFDADDRSVREKKRNDLRKRERIMNESQADLFISIHMNKFEDSRYSGPQVFYSPNTEFSGQLAEALQSELIAVLQPSSHREIKKASSDIYLLKKAEIPAVLVECGFLSNPQEESLLQNEDYQNRIAWAIYSGVIKFLAQ